MGTKQIYLGLGVPISMTANWVAYNRFSVLVQEAVSPKSRCPQH